MPPPAEREADLTEAGRPRVPRPMPDTSDATHCPHCGAEVGAGHYVCWNCSKDIRMKERTEEEILDEYQDMLVAVELRLETRNQRFFAVTAALSLLFAVAGVVLHFRIGIVVIFVVFALLMGWLHLRSSRRAGRIRAAHRQAP